MIMARGSGLGARGIANTFKFYFIFLIPFLSFLSSFLFSQSTCHLLALPPIPFGTCECGPRAHTTCHFDSIQ